MVLMLAGVALIPGSCLLFPSQFGSDYTGINIGGPLGGLLGVILALIGLIVTASASDSKP